MCWLLQGDRRKPLWLRLEWNLIDVDLVTTHLQQCQGLVYDIPKAEKSAGHSHEHKLTLSRLTAGCDLRLPWLQCQKQAPAEAQLLRSVKDVFRAQGPWLRPPPQPAAAVAASISPAATAQPAVTAGGGGGSGLTPPPPPPPAVAGAADRSAASWSLSSTSTQAFGRGPLLLFPDTSALLSMLGANAQLGPPVLSMSSLQALAATGQFGRSLPAMDQAFIVIADSVMKQLDGLKTVPETRQVGAPCLSPPVPVQCPHKYFCL